MIIRWNECLNKKKNPDEVVDICNMHDVGTCRMSEQNDHYNPSIHMPFFIRRNATNRFPTTTKTMVTHYVSCRVGCVLCMREVAEPQTYLLCAVGSDVERSLPLVQIN